MPYMTPTAADKIVYTGRFLLLAMCILVTACSGKKEKSTEKSPVPVRTAVSATRTVPVQIRVIGNVEAYATVSIKSQVNGRLEKVHFREGDDVRQGALLFTIDSRTFEAALRQARAALARDLAQERYAREQVRRYGELLREGIVSRDQYEQLQANADALTETVRADRAAVDDAAVMLGYCFIRSPIDGRTGSLMVQSGNLVRANDDPVLVTINRINPIYVTFSVPEKELAEIRKHMEAGDLKVEALIPNDSGPAEQGSLSFLDNAVDAATGTIKAKGTFANSGKRLWPGQFVDVVLTLATIPHAVVVPSQAVQMGQEGEYVFVVKPDRTVTYRQVSAGETHNGDRVIMKGLAAGETVVIDGHLNLVPGAAVTIRQDTPDRQVTR
jgi:multidrug efflux system membrane fusion protein